MTLKCSLQDRVADEEWEEDIQALIREEEAERKRKMSLNIPSPLDFVSYYSSNIQHVSYILVFGTCNGLHKY